ncbi:MAG: hypothetical protein RR937_08965, partial [Ruthenibacterium sp.]
TVAFVSAIYSPGAMALLRIFFHDTSFLSMVLLPIYAGEKKYACIGKKSVCTVRRSTMKDITFW